MKSFSTAVLVMLLAVGLVAAAGGPARATLIAYDGFATTNPPSDYLHGSLGSVHCTGFSAAWTAVTGVNGYFLTGTSLSLPINNLGTEGGHVLLRSINSANATRPLTTPLLADSGNTWYLSAELIPAAATSNGAYAMFGLASTATLTKTVLTGCSWYLTDPIGEDLILRITGGVNVRGNMSLGYTPHFYVMKVATHTDGSVDVYAKIYANTDTLPTTEPAWDLHTSFTGLSGVSYGYAFLQGRAYYNYGAIPNEYDELRIGTTWGDVVAIPEPSALALLGMGLVGLLCYAWRKRK